MGGLWSGTWTRPTRKPVVEQSIVLDTRPFTKRRWRGGRAIFRWMTNTGVELSIGVILSQEVGAPTLQLVYNKREAKFRTAVWLTSTPVHFGGKRWWFRCPMKKDGVACVRRCAKLYCPLGSAQFGCRLCHGLSYRSCQEAHKMERMREMPAKLKARVEYLSRRFEAR